MSMIAQLDKQESVHHLFRVGLTLDSLSLIQKASDCYCLRRAQLISNG